jgi:uncharacterized protein
VDHRRDPELIESIRGAFAMSNLTVRYPTFDFSDSSPRWGDNDEAVVIINAGAIIPPSIERYLIRVMRQAKKLLDPVADADLIRDIELFNKQEGQHLKIHSDLVALLRDNGYPRIVEFEAAFAADLAGYLETKPLDWNLAYCEGFESTGVALAEAWINGHVKELCGDHGSEVMRLWMWHMAEEFEHRSVVHDVLERLYGHENAFELRKSGADFNRQHNAEHAVAAAAYLHEVNRQGMSPDELEASQAREMDAWIAMGEASAEGMTWVYQEDYDPGKVAPPRDYEALLAPYNAAAST